MPQFGNAAQAGSWLQFGSYIGTNITGHRNVGDSTGRARGYYSIDGRLAKVAIPGQPILTGYGTYVRGTDVVTQALKDQLERNLINYELRFYIQDNNSKWVDFSDRCEWRGKNSLMRVGTLEYSAERLRGQLEQKISNVIVDNSDGFWDAPFPSTLKATYDGSWNLLADASASTSWTDSTNGYETALYHHKAAIRAHYRLVGTETDSIMTMGIFLVEDVLTSANDSSATIRISPLSSVLINSTAEDVKQGQGWYQNRRPKFLVEQLLKKQLRAAGTNDIPTDYDLDDIVDVDVPLSGASAWVSSHYGRPPEQMVSVAGATSWNINEVRVCKAVLLWEYGAGVGTATGTMGSIAVDPTTATVTGTSTQWLAADHATLHCPRVGDAFIIPKEYASGDGGSTLGHDSKYTIVAINSDTSIELDRPPVGTAAESGLKYSICRLYMGVGPELYEYNLATDTHRQLNTSGNGAGALANNYHIRRIWHNSYDTTYPIWGVAITEEETSITSTMKIFRFRWNGSSIDFDVWGETGISSVFMGDKIIREEVTVSGSGTRNVIGDVVASAVGAGADGARIYLPYKQKLYNIAGNSFDVVDDQGGTTLYTAHSRKDGGGNVISNVSHDLPSGTYGATSSSAMSLVYSLGQTGVMVFNENYTTNGAILFCKTTGTEASDMLDFTYHLISLSQSDPDSGSGSPTPVDLANDASGYFVFTSPAINCRNYIPQTACADSATDDFYVCATKFAADSSSEIFRIVFKITAFAASPSTTVSRLHYNSSSEFKSFLEIIHTSVGLFFSVVNLSTLRTTTAYSIGYLSASTADTTTYTVKKNFSGQPQGLQRRNINTSGSPTYKIWFLESGSSSWKHLPNTSTADDTLTIMTDVPAVTEDSFSISNIIGSDNLRAMFWVSGPVPVINSPNKEEGKFYLCRWSNTIPARVELADFSGLTLWDAIRMVAEVVNARYGFLPDGSFFFKRWPRSQSSSYTFTNLGQNRIAGIEKSRGLEYIVNYSAKTPARVTFDDTKISLILTPDSKFGEKSKSESDSGENYKHRFDVLNRATDAKTVKLVCIEGGRIATAVDTNVEARFKYSVVTSTTNTSLNAAYTHEDVYLDIESPEDVVYGTEIEVRGYDANGDEQTATAKVGYAPSYTATTSIPYAPQIFTAEALDQQRSDISVVQSTNITGADDNGVTLTPGSIIMVGDVSAEQNYEYMQVTSVEATKIHVARGIGSKIPGSTIHAAGESIILIRQGTKVYTGASHILSNTLDFNIGDSVTLDHPSNNVWSDSYISDPNDSTSSVSDSQYWIPVDGQFIPIGEEKTPRETGLSLMIEYSSGTYSRQPKFSVGDQIRLETKGLITSQDQASVKVWSDYSSIYKWQKRESQLGDNRFYDDRTALWAAMREVQDNSNPKYGVEIAAAAMPWLSLLDIVTVQDPKMFPGQLEHQITAYVAAISYELNSMGAATYSLRAVLPY